MNFKTFYPEFLAKKPLYVIRELGRVMGVKAPSSKTKDTVIKEIILIQRGELQPVSKKNKGAPPKFKIDLSEFILKGMDARLPDYYPPIKKEENQEDIERLSKENFTYEPPKEGEENTSKLVFNDSGKGTKVIDGILEMNPNGYGFIRVNQFQPSQDDGYISNHNIRKYDLRHGDSIKARVKLNSPEDGCPATQEVLEVNGLEPRSFIVRENFDDLVARYPEEKIELSKNNNKTDLRLIDMFCPIGKGQRGLIVAPPKTGKTTIIKNIAKAIEENCPEIMLMVLLIDERPEEVTDIKNSINSQVYYSTFDENTEHHIRIAEHVIGRAKRFVEIGKDVVILLDSLTRLTRAYNVMTDATGRTLSGGLEASALIQPKKFFGSGRNVDKDGSLTILATALIDTGSRLDDVIFEEFKGTGNMEIHLSKDLAEKRVYPAIDLFKSGTRKDELLLTDEELVVTGKLRGILSDSSKATEQIIDLINKTENNKEFIKVYEK